MNQDDSVVLTIDILPWHFFVKNIVKAQYISYTLE